jgi:hypothetical protein
MKRRAFLSTTILAGAGIAALPGIARGLTVESCEGDAASWGCRELARHRQALAELMAQLEKKGLSAEELRAALMAARCPFCGEPIAG